MMLIKKSHVSSNIYKEIVDSYFCYLKGNKISLNGHEVSELLRYSLCILMELETTIMMDREEYVDGCLGVLRPIIDKYHICDQTVEYRQGLLESCVHCIEYARRYVTNGRV